MGEDTYTPAAYAGAFGVGNSRDQLALSELVEARLERSSANDPLDDLIGAAPHQVQAWMQRKATLADGHTVGLPVCGMAALRQALESNLDARGPWLVEESRKVWNGEEIAWHGLLRSLCGLTWQEIANLGDGSVSRARRMGRAHERILQCHAMYAERLGEVGHSAISRCVWRTRA